MSDLEQLIRNIVRDELAKAKPANDAVPEFVTVAEYARRWSLSESTVRQAIADRRLESTRIGRARRIPADARIARRVGIADDATARARLVLLGGGKAR